MLNKLSYERSLLEAGKTLAFATAPGGRLRVVDGTVWATTSGCLDDVWLHSGDEYRFGRSGLTVIESTRRSVVELAPRIGSGRMPSIASFVQRFRPVRNEPDRGEKA